jgi:hypothetical protein
MTCPLACIARASPHPPAPTVARCMSPLQFKLECGLRHTHIHACTLAGGVGGCGCNSIVQWQRRARRVVGGAGSATGRR